MHPRILRIIDANINRVSEGLRILEDVARFIIEDANSSHQLKSIRHQINHLIHKLSPELIFSRQADSDIGANFDVTVKHDDLPLMVKANAKRVQEGLRVIEELAKLPDLKYLRISASIKNARYIIYTLEKTITVKLLRKDILERFKGLHIVINLHNIEPRNLTSLVAEIVQSGANAVELTGELSAVKKHAMLDLLDDIKKLCAQKNVLLILHDHLDLALICHPDCFCMEDLSTPVQILRQQLHYNTLIGCQARTSLQARKAIQRDIDYILIDRGIDTQSISGKSQSRKHLYSMITQYSSRIAVAVNIDADFTDIPDLLIAGAVAFTVDSSLILEDNIGTEIKKLVGKIETSGKNIQKTRGPI